MPRLNRQTIFMMKRPQDIRSAVFALLREPQMFKAKCAEVDARFFLQ